MSRTLTCTAGGVAHPTRPVRPVEGTRLIANVVISIALVQAGHVLWATNNAKRARRVCLVVITWHVTLDQSRESIRVRYTSYCTVPVQ